MIDDIKAKTRKHESAIFMIKVQYLVDVVLVNIEYWKNDMKGYSFGWLLLKPIFSLFLSTMAPDPGSV